TERPTGRLIEVRCSVYHPEGSAGLALPAYPAAWKGDGGAAARFFGTGGEGMGAVPRTAPRLVFPDGTSGTVSILEPRSFVAECGPHWTRGAGVAAPMAGTGDAGLRSEAGAALLEEGKGIDLSATLTWTDLVSPMAQTETLLVAWGAPVTVASPILCAQRLST